MDSIDFTHHHPRFYRFIFLIFTLLVVAMLGQSASSPSLAATPVIAGSSTQGRLDQTISAASDRSVIEETESLTPTLFYDDFSGDLSQWSDQTANWYIDQGELVGQGINYTDAWIYAGDPSWTDYAMQTRVTFINNHAMLALRTTGHLQNEYLINLWSQEGEYPNSYQVVRYRDGEYYFVTALIKSPVPITNPSLVEVQISGDRLFLYINSHFVRELTDPDPLANGRIGLGVFWEYTARFDDVRVSTLPPIMLIPPDQEKIGWAGEPVTYMLELENQTGITDTFNVEVLPGNLWTTTLSTAQVGPIADGESAFFSARVNIPPSVQPGEVDIATILATSVISPGVTGTAVLTSTAVSHDLAFVTQSTNEVIVIDRTTESVIESVNVQAMGCHEPWRLRLTPTGSTLYLLCSGTSSLHALHVPDLTLEYSLSYPGGAEDDIVFTPDESYAFISSRNQTSIQVLDIEAITITKTIPLVGEGIITSLETSPTGDKIYAAGALSDGGQIYVIDPHLFEVVSMIQFGRDVWDVIHSPDGKWIYASDRWGAGIAIIDAETYEIVDVILDTGELTGLALSPDGATIFAGRENFGTVDAYDLDSHSYITSIMTGGVVRDLTRVCSGEELYVASMTNVLSVIDTGTHLLDSTIPTPADSYGVAVSPPCVHELFIRKVADRPFSSPGAAIGYAITMSNLGTDPITDVVLTDTLPITLTYKAGSLTATSGSYGYQNGIISWTGSMTAGTPVTLNFMANVSPYAIPGSSITNRITVSAADESFDRSATIEIIPNHIYVPCAYKPCVPTFSDDFSDPASGWPVMAQDNYSMGYVNGKYRMTVEPGWITWATRNFGASNYRVEVDVHPATSLDGGAGIFFGITGDGFYFFEVSDGWFSLWRNDTVSWTWRPLIDWTQSPAVKPGYQTNRLKVIRIGDSIMVYANNQILGTVYDGTYQGTTIGLANEAFSAYTEALFDNFLIFTGACYGEPGAVLSLNQEASYDAMWAEPGSGSKTRP